MSRPFLRVFRSIFCFLLALLAGGLPARAGEKWAVIVGVNDYGENIPHLRFAAADAKRLYGLMTQCTPPDHVILLASGAGRAPTRANILGSLTSLAGRAKPDDEFWFCFSGHGEDQNRTHYLLPSDASVSNYKGTAINLKDVRDGLTQHCAAGRKIMMVDACHSGWDDLGGGRRSVGAGDAVLWASCSARESSWEIPELGEGVFTWFFLKRQGEIAPNRLSLPSQDDAGMVNTHVETYIRRNKKPFTQTPQVIGTLPSAGAIPWGSSSLPDSSGSLAARDSLGPVLLVDLPDARRQLNGATIKSEIAQAALRQALLRANFPLVDRPAARQLRKMLDRKTAAAGAKKLGAAYLIRGRAETQASKLAITRDFINVQATITAELVDEAGNVLAQAVIGGTEDDPVAGSDIHENVAATMALTDAIQKLTAVLLPKLRTALAARPQ